MLAVVYGSRTSAGEQSFHVRNRGRTRGRMADCSKSRLAGPVAGAGLIRQVPLEDPLAALSVHDKGGVPCRTATLKVASGDPWQVERDSSVFSESPTRWSNLRDRKSVV